MRNIKYPKRLNLRVTHQQEQELIRKSGQKGLSLSDYIRERLFSKKWKFWE